VDVMFYIYIQAETTKIGSVGYKVCFLSQWYWPLCQYIAIALRILVLSVSFIVLLVVQCYSAHWLSILSITS